MRSLFFFFILLKEIVLFGQGFKTLPCHQNSSKELTPKIQNKINQIVKKGVPGIVVAIESNGILSIGSAGLAKIEDSIPMQVCHLQYLGSIPKTYMATLIMKLYEEDKIDLNTSVINYLPKDIISYVNGIEKITVKMLLNHTSGFPEYNNVPNYITLLLQYPEKVFKPKEMLKFTKGKKLIFEPGSKYVYTNSNYELLSIIADNITGDHALYLREKILDPLGLKNTYYRIQAGNTYNNRLVNNYWDRYSNGILENSSILLNSNTASMAGDDGIVSIPEDAISFLKGLMEGKILKPETLEMMKEWVKDDNGNPTYGLGLDFAEINGLTAYGHSGAGLGTGAQLYYFPEMNTYMFLAINLATVTDSPIHKKALPLVDELYQIILKSDQ